MPSEQAFSGIKVLLGSCEGSIEALLGSVKALFMLV
jgi:hypothetical protein